MSAKPTYETQRIDHLGIVSGICQGISLIEKIDTQVIASDRNVTCGKGTQAIILNALDFVGRALYMYGYSKDHRPDLKQVVLRMITHHKSALPVWLEVLSGNSNDKKTFKATIKTYCKALGVEEQAYVVMDSAGFSEETLKEAKDIFWLMRVPETLVQAKKLVKETLAKEMLELEPGYWGKEVVCEYAGIQQRWLVVFSQAAQARESKTLEKAQAKELEKAKKEWRKLEGQTFNCQTDAEKALDQFNQKWKFHQANAKAAPLMQYSRRGRPSAEDKKEVVGHNLQGDVEENPTAIEAAKRS